MAGRGWGKSRTGAEWLGDQALKTPKSNWAVIAPTKDDVRETCFEGESGLLAALGMTRDDPRYNQTRQLIRLGTGTVITSYSAETPKKARGPNLYGVWLEEIAQWKSSEMWDNLFPAVRRGLAQAVITSTPDRTKLVREFAHRDDGSVVITHGTTYDNADNLAEATLAELRTRWEGTRKARQELMGELLEDVPGALWTAENIERTRAVLID